ncbi:MAG: nucleoside recognition domain-containing protein [Rhodospirillaceae bacterium]
MNAVFIAIVTIAFGVAAVRQVTWQGAADAAPMAVMGKGMIDAATGSVTLAIGLVGVMALFLGLMKVAEKGGLLVVIAKTLRPSLVRLFPDVPAGHPAMGAMILNMAANVLGLGNAATPFGIRAMQQLQTLNRDKATASDSMALFLAINTSSVTILPTGVIALRAAAGSQDAAGIVPTTLFATICSTAVAIFMAKFLAKRWKAPPPPAGAPADEPAPDGEGAEELAGDLQATDWQAAAGEAYPAWVSVTALLAVAALVPLTVFYGRAIAPWIVPGLMLALLGFGWFKKVPVYEAFVEGAKDGFEVALRIIPYLVAILVAVGMFRASGAMDLIVQPLGALTGLVGLPADALPMALLRPLSGSGAYGIMASIIQDRAIGPDSYVGYLVSTIQGSTETTFYVLAVYFGAVGIRRLRHTLVAALTADVAGVAAAVFIVGMLYG